jgi:trehalose 6-phosphate phosphatase
MSRSLLDCLEELAPRLKAARSLALFLDFDGTLVSFADEPDQVQLPLSLRQLLLELSASDDRIVALVSGRERADLQTRIGIPGLIYAGNHGLEISGPGFIFVEALAIGYREPLQKLAQALVPRVKPIEGAWVEDKGMTITVHWRRVAPDKTEELRHIVHGALENTSHPFVLTAGEKVYDIKPRVYWNKGEAVKWILERVGKQDALTLYLGDDATDEDAFAALPEGITIKVGEATDTAAAYHVRCPSEAQRFLEWLADQVR